MSEQTIISVQDTYGAGYWAAGKLGIHKPGHLAMAGVVLVGTSWITLGIPAGLLALLIAGNDIIAATKKRKVKPPKDVLRLQEGAWKFIGGSTTTALPESAERTINEPEAIPVPSETVPETTPEEQPAPAVPTTPAPEKPKPEYPNNPWGKPAAEVPTPPTTTPDYDPGKPYDPDHERDFEKEIEAQVQERAERMMAEKMGTAQTSPQGIVSELFVKEDGYYRSWFVMAPTGSGKGVFICYATIMAKANMPGVSIWAVDPKSDPLEYSRWAHISENQRYHYNALQPTFDHESENMIKGGVKKILAGYAADTSKYKILIIDELPAILKTLGSSGRSTLRYFNAIASMGRSSNSLVWLFSNSIGLNQNGVTKADKSYYHLMYLTTPRKLSAITVIDTFEGQKISADDDVFKATGRAGWTSTKGHWEPVPTAYFDVVSRLPEVMPPAGFGAGQYKDSQGEVALANLAEELVEALLEQGFQKGNLADMIALTSFAHLLEGDNKEKTLKTLGAGLKRYPEVITVRVVQARYVVALPQQAAQKEEPAETEGWTLDFL